MVFWLLSMLANRDKDEMSRTLLALSSSQDSCIAMRKSGCVPLLVQILHEVPGGVPGDTTGGGGGCGRDTRSRASAALHNIVFSQQDEGQAHREMKVLHMLEQIRTYCDSGWDWLESHTMTPSPGGTKTSGEPKNTHKKPQVNGILLLHLEGYDLMEHYLLGKSLSIYQQTFFILWNQKQNLV